MRWLAKLRRYGGGESVLGYYDTREQAQERVTAWNDRYQTDTAYVEEWDAQKAAQWPTLARRQHENGLLR